jgi:hypothetical protein
MDYNGLKGSVLILGLIMALLKTTTYAADLTGPNEANRIIKTKGIKKVICCLGKCLGRSYYRYTMRQYFQYATCCCIDEC